MRFKLLLIILITAFISSVVQPFRADGSDNEKTGAQVLSRQAVIDLALKNFVDVKLAQIRYQSSTAQLGYVQTQKNIESVVGQAPMPSRLPTLPEELLKEIPNYDQLSDEEKAEVDQMIVIQSMINHSFNQFIDAQNSQQFNAMVRDKATNLATLSETVRSLSTDKEIAYLELEKTKKLVEFYAVQQYYSHLKAGNALKSAQIEADYLNSRVRDANLLNSSGMITELELEQAKSKLQKQQNRCEQQSSQYELQLKIFKLELGMDAEQAVVLENVILTLPDERDSQIAINLDGIYELRQADEAIKLAKENYESVSGNNSNQSNYYLAIWNAKKEERAILKRQMEQRLMLLEQEGNAIYEEAKELIQDRDKLLQNIQDYEALLLNGRITVRDLEDLQLELAKLNLAINNGNLSYKIFQEKQALASKGILLGTEV